MVQRVRNVIKRDNKKARGMPSEEEVPEPKRRKKGVDLLRRYPVSNSISTNTHENAESLELHKKAMGTKLAKAKPRDSVLLPLMRSTYGERRVFILNEATSVQAILQTHRALSRPAIVSANVCLGLILNRWTTFKPSRWFYNGPTFMRGGRVPSNNVICTHIMGSWSSRMPCMSMYVHIYTTVQRMYTPTIDYAACIMLVTLDKCD